MKNLVIGVEGVKYTLKKNETPFADCELCKLSLYCDKCDEYGEPAHCLFLENYYFEEYDKKNT